MRRFLLIAVGLVASFTNPVFANDHNNLDSGRPLSLHRSAGGRSS